METELFKIKGKGNSGLKAYALFVVFFNSCAFLIWHRWYLNYGWLFALATILFCVIFEFASPKQVFRFVYLDDKKQYLIISGNLTSNYVEEYVERNDLKYSMDKFSGKSGNGYLIKLFIKNKPKYSFTLENQLDDFSAFKELFAHLEENLERIKW